jgi:hypothetical protein
MTLFHLQKVVYRQNKWNMIDNVENVRMYTTSDNKVRELATVCLP